VALDPLAVVVIQEEIFDVENLCAVGVNDDFPVPVWLRAGHGDSKSEPIIRSVGTINQQLGCGRLTQNRSPGAQVFRSHSDSVVPREVGDNRWDMYLLQEAVGNHGDGVVASDAYNDPTAVHRKAPVAL
jgi:hypothetical protein